MAKKNPKPKTTRRHRRRRRRGSLGPFLRVLSVLLTAVAIVAAITLFFKVGEVEVVGATRYTPEEIIATSQVQEGDNLVLLDKYHIAQRIYTELPYISEVSFDRKFPDRLEISVRETSAAFALPGAGTWWLVSMDGKLLEPVAEDVGKANMQLIGYGAVDPVVSGSLILPEESPVTAERLVELLSALGKRGMLEKTQSIDLSDPRVLSLNYDKRFRVEFYYTADFNFKLDCLSATVESLQPNETGIIRMTMEDDSEVRFIPYTQ